MRIFSANIAMSPEASDELGSESGGALKNIFGLLEKNLPASGDQLQVSIELREKMERFANGKIPPDEIENLSAQILGSPETIRAFAEILGRLA